ncbi:hypothetical protein NLU13_3282 [Sarocladium strictum]|uniref:Uncharacterized protein n=1 Tax=Sarocladium strictum TaxID=5046 RepID=A0AA39GNI9_SARSR|nr:hypothetical protein NLU13_3282 [Sarocladium strictum]
MMEVGDVLKFAELAWFVYDYGWSPELNANRQYNEFFRDVEQLAQSLEDLAGVVKTARQSFTSRCLTPPPATFGWDRDTLLDIIGDFDATLRECYRLIKQNKSYAAASGPIMGPLANVRWNAMVMPSVDRLRQRLLMHQAKIQHMLRPFEIDLHIRIHQDLAQRINDVHEDVRLTQAGVRTILREIQALKRHFDPSPLLDGEPTQQDNVPNTVSIPDVILERLEHSFAMHPERVSNSGGALPLRDMADAFVKNLDAASPLYESNGAFLEAEEDGHTATQYVALLTCQFLMPKMLDSDEVTQAPAVSHWPRYVQSLHQQLQNACLRFNQSMSAGSLMDEISDLEISPIWEEEAPAPYIESATLPAAIEHILELPLKIDYPRRWRKMNVFRYCDGTDRRFRLLLTAGNDNQPAAETRRVDFDLEHTSLVPRYASPDGKEPLEMVLKPRDEMFRLEFFTRSDLYLFQQALTGYEVVDNYMSYRVKTIFVADRSAQNMKQHASIQLWQPARLDGNRTTEDADVTDVEDDTDSFTSYARSPPTAYQSRSTSWSTEHTIPRRPVPTSSNRRQSSTNMNSIPTSQTRDSWNTQSGAASRSTALATSPSRSYPVLRRMAIGMGSPTQPQPPEQRQTRAPSSASLSSSNSSSSAGTVRRRDQGRQGSFSTQSMNTKATSMMSSATSRTVLISGGANTAPVGTLHCKPGEPMLVFFTRDIEAGVHGIVAVSLDQGVTANFHACGCTRMPNCQIATVEKAEQDHNSGDPLSVVRMGGVAGQTTWWDILSLAESMKSWRATAGPKDRENRAWQRVIRVSMYFEKVDERKEFSGYPCTCKLTSLEGGLMDCLHQGHRGRLGLVRENFRREMKDWYERRYRNQVNMLDRAQRLGPGND